MQSICRLDHVIRFILFYQHLSLQYQKNQTMGCTDSKLSTSEQEKQEENRHNKEVRFGPDVEDDTHFQQHTTINKENQAKTQTKKSKKSTGKEKDSESKKSLTKQEKQNRIKVKRAKQLHNKTQNEKLINAIMDSSRHQLIAQIPSIPNKASQFTKPVIEYSPHQKGNILSNECERKLNNKWNTPISDGFEGSPRAFTVNASYIAVNQNMKSPNKQREIQKRLEDIRNGRYNQSKSGRIVNMMEYNQFESNQTLHL